jgi:hypothetical protein
MPLITIILTLVVLLELLHHKPQLEVVIGIYLLLVFTTTGSVQAEILAILTEIAVDKLVV